MTATGEEDEIDDALGAKGSRGLRIELIGHMKLSRHLPAVSLSGLNSVTRPPRDAFWSGIQGSLLLQANSV